MESAGAEISRVAMEMLSGIPFPKVHIFCGSGNNGGDGFVAARHLINRGAQVWIYTTRPHGDFKGDAQVALQVLLTLGVEPIVLEDNLIGALPLFGDLIIDALLGTGAQGPPRTPVPRIIERINASEMVVLSVDLVSGQNGDEISQEWPCIQADVTLSLGALKPSQVFYPNCLESGRVQWAPLGFPRHRLMEIPWMLVESDDIIPGWPRRSTFGHKGQGGKLLVWAGSEGMMGAGHLCTQAAQVAGASMVQWICPKSQVSLAQTLNPEAMALSLPEEGGRLNHEASLEAILDRVKWADAIVIGPGLGTSPDTAHLLKELLPLLEIPVLVDADALNILAPFNEETPRPKSHWVITPHRGEAAKCFGHVPLGGTELMRWTTKIARDHQLCLHLKGPPSLTSTAMGEVFVNGTGNELLSSAGSGDLLAGISGALLAMGLLPPHAIFAAAHVHGLCADRLKEKGEELGHQTLDLLKQLPDIINGR